MGIYMSSKFGGPCWSRDRGYHTPAPLPPHIMRIITQRRRDSGRPPKGGDANAAPGEAGQSGGAKTPHRPEPGAIEAGKEMGDAG